ncbi:MAG: hypothetical protein QHH13_06065 [Melioribacter sp.]|uniref:hypothetical protein n=1 Tax=Rosettibacter primus TaxID=3111523 RepID=UPI00247E9A97|nr:hypothetical protein [Melioribacter sp.]
MKASELEKKVLMINDGLPIGGTCVNVGCVPSKTLIRTAEQFHIANHRNFSGIISGNSKIDFKEVIRQKTELVESLREHKYIHFPFRIIIYSKSTIGAYPLSIFIINS